MKLTDEQTAEHLTQSVALTARVVELTRDRDAAIVALGEWARKAGALETRVATLRSEIAREVHVNLGSVKDALCKGEFSSFSLSWNDGNGPDYMSVADYLASWPTGDDDFVGGAEERRRCIDSNSIWSAQWYPKTPVGFCVLHAATFDKLMEGLRSEIARLEKEASDGQ